MDNVRFFPLGSSACEKEKLRKSRRRVKFCTSFKWCDCIIISSWGERKTQFQHELIDCKNRNPWSGERAESDISWLMECALTTRAPAVPTHTNILVIEWWPPTKLRTPSRHRKSRTPTPHFIIQDNRLVFLQLYTSTGYLLSSYEGSFEFF